MTNTLMLIVFGVLVPAIAVFFSLWKGKKPINYIFLAISLALY